MGIFDIPTTEEEKPKVAYPKGSYFGASISAIPEALHNLYGKVGHLLYGKVKSPEKRGIFDLPNENTDINTAVQNVTKTVKEPSLLKRFWDNFTDTNPTFKRKLNMEGFLSNKPKSDIDPNALQGKYIGPTEESIAKQHNELLKLKDEIDTTNEKSVNDFNFKVGKLQNDINVYEKIFVGSGEGSLGPTKYQQLEKGITSAFLIALAPEIGLSIAGAESAGLAIGPVLLKYATNLGIGIPTFTAIDKALQPLKDNVSDPLKFLISTAELFGVGGLLHGLNKAVPKVGDRLFQTVTEKYNAPKTIYFNPGEVKDIYKTGKLLTPEEQRAFAQATGGDRTKIKNAFENGISIEIPATKIKKVAELPFWTKIKNAFGIEPTTGEIVKTIGKGKETVRGYLPERTGVTPQDIQNIALRFRTKEELSDKPEKISSKLVEEARKYKSAKEFILKMRGSATQYTDYTPELRKGGISKEDFRITEKGVNPELEVTIYRGVPNTKTRIVEGDFVTTDRLSAESYAGKNNVISKKVKAKDLIHDDPNNFDPKNPFRIGSEFIYSDSKNKLTKYTDEQLTDIYNKAVGKEEPKFNTQESRKMLPEQKYQPERVKAYKERLKLRSADPVLVDLILTPDNTGAYGVTVGGRMMFEKVVQRFTEDHEIGHLVWDNLDRIPLFKKFDKEELYSEAKELYGDLTKPELEEKVMEDFQIYVRDREAGKESTFFGAILDFFRRLYASLKRLFRNEKDIKEFYRVMYEGKANKETVITPNERLREFADRAERTGIADFADQQYQVGKFLEKTPIEEVFNNKGDLTLKTLTKLQGRSTVSKQFIEDLTNSGDIKQPERDLIRAMLETEPETVNVPQFAQRVKDELLPLKRVDQSRRGGVKDYENIALPSELRGNVANYSENIYNSPIKTSAGQIHFPRGTDYYFGHTRIEDMSGSDETKMLTGPKAGLRRVIEIQSDLYQKDRLESERPIGSDALSSEQRDEYYSLLDKASKGLTPEEMARAKELEKTQNDFMKSRDTELAKLQQYNNPSAHFRMVREEVRKAAQDGKTRLLFPTGETAMKIEGLGSPEVWNYFPSENSGSERLNIENAKIGQEIFREDTRLPDGSGFDENKWIITEVLGDGRFKAVPKGTYEEFQLANDTGHPKDLENRLRQVSEQFDISGKVDTNNPIYRFYEKDLGRYLKNNFDAKPVTDDKGVTWMEVNVDPGYADLPVPAFNKKPDDIENLRKQLDRVQQSLDAAIAQPEAHKIAYGPGKVEEYKAKIKDLKQRIYGQKFPALEDVKDVLKNVEQRLGVSSVVKSIKEQEALLEINKEVLDSSPMKNFEKYVATGGTYKGGLPEVGGRIAELKKSGDFKGNTNPNALIFAHEGDAITQEIAHDYGMKLDSEEARKEFDQYLNQKKGLKDQEKELKKQKDLFKTTNTLKLTGIDKTLIGEITQTKEIPQTIKEIIDQVNSEKKARREEVLNHKARPLMKYVDKKSQRLPAFGSKSAFGKEGEQILKDLGFEDVKEANRALSNYISKRNEFVNPVSRLALKERSAKFLRDKQKILEEVEKKIRAEARSRKQKIESIRDFFYMTEGEVREAIGDTDYRLLSDSQFETLLEKVKDKSIEIALHSVAVAEVEWTIAEKELHRVENLQEVLEYPKNLNDLTTEQLDNLNEVLGKFERGDVFLGVREMETLAKNAGLPDVKTQRQILEEVLGKRSGLPVEKLREIMVGSFDELRSAISLSRQNAFYEVMVNDFYQLKIEAGLKYREIEQKTNELVKKARASRPQSWKQKLAPTDDMVIAYLEEGDMETKAKIAENMSNAELELAHYVKEKYAEMRDFLISRQQLEKERQNYYTHRPRGFFESWLRNEVVKTPTQFFRAFGRAFKETFIDVNKMDEATFKILNEQTSEILPLEKFFKYSMRRSGQLIPTKNLANAFLGYVKTFELKRGLDQYMPRMEAVARALTPTETTEGGIVKDTSLERFVKKWINTQKGRPVTIGPIQPGGVLDGLLRGGVAFTRFLDLALRFPAQFMSLVGEESSTWINIGSKKYLTGQYRAKTKQGKKIAKEYESFIGTKFWDKMKEESSGLPSKLGETLFAFYGIASRNANIHHLLGVLTKEEFSSGKISIQRLAEIKKEMTRWRADDLLHSVMGKTSVGAVFREHKSWAIPIINQTLSNIKTLSKMVKSGEYKTAGKSREFGELFRATLLTAILVLTITKIYKDLKEKKDRSFFEELEYRAMNDAFSFISALSPTTLFAQPRLMSWLGDLSKSLALFVSAMVTGDRTATGKIPGAKGLRESVTPKLLKPLFTPDEEDKVSTSISTSAQKAKTKLEDIDSSIVEPAQTAWDEVKKAGVGSEAGQEIVDNLSDPEYEAYKLVKSADEDYWKTLVEKITPIVKRAKEGNFKDEKVGEEIDALTDEEFKLYKQIKKTMYGSDTGGDITGTSSDADEEAQKAFGEGVSKWDKQSFVTHITNIAKAIGSDPIDTFNNIFHGDWKVTGVKNGQVIVNRMSLEESQKIKKDLGGANSKFKLDHIIPVEGGGNNQNPKNLQLIPTDQWEINTPVEVYLINKLSDGVINGDELREYIIRFKAGQGEILSDSIKKEYEKDYNSQPLTFEQIKELISNN